MKENLEESLVHSESLYEGQIVRLRKDTVTLPNQKTSTREVLDHDPAVVIVGVTSEGTILCVQQYRYAVEETLIELPAGLMDPEETPLEAAKREFREETGYSADHWQSLGGVYPAPGFCNEFLHFFLATDLTAGHQDLDQDEFVEPLLLDLSELESKISSGDITDAKTIIGLYYYKQLSVS